VVELLFQASGSGALTISQHYNIFLLLRKQKDHHQNMTMSSSDPKLTHLVRKFLSVSVDSEPNADHIVHCLRNQHKEYQRKDLSKLKKQVLKVLKQIGEASNGDDSKPSSSNDDKEEEEYDKDAEAHDSQRNNLDTAMGGGGLNASLTAQYRKLQQNRADEAAAATATAETSGVPADIKFLDTSVDGGRSNKRSREEGELSNHAKVSDMMHSSSKNGKSSKRKKSLSKRQSSSSAGLDAYQKGESNRGDGATVSEAVPRPTERYTDLGGMEDVLKQIRQLVEYPLVRPELYRHLGVDPPRGVLLRGPPG
jgi:SpoVK/Ycf46/Vps4 family AAA+-type ATPase